MALAPLVKFVAAVAALGAVGPAWSADMVVKAPSPVVAAPQAGVGWYGVTGQAAGVMVVPAPMPPPPIFYFGAPQRVYLFPAPGETPRQCWVGTDPRGYGYWWPC